MKKTLFLVGILFLFLIIKTPVYAADVVINEIIYDLQTGNDEGREWIEIYNKGTGMIDLTDWRFREDGSNHVLNQYQGGLSLSPDQYAVIVDSPTGFLNDYPGFSGIIIDSSWGSFSNSGETLTLLESVDATVPSEEVTYQSSWGANGTGYSLERISFTDDSNSSSNWREGTLNGSPGSANSSSPAPTATPITTNTPTPTKLPTATPTKTPTSTPTKTPTGSTPTQTKSPTTTLRIEENPLAGEAGSILAENVAISASPSESIPTPGETLTAEFIEANLAKILIIVGGTFLVACGILFFKWKRKVIVNS